MVTEKTNTRSSYFIFFSQLKDMALKASGAYRNCSPCTGPPTLMMAMSQAQSRLRVMGESDVESEKFWWSYMRTRSSNSRTRVWGKEMEESEWDIELERRRDTEFGEWAQSRTGGAVRGGERVKGVGGSGLVFFFF